MKSIYSEKPICGRIVLVLDKSGSMSSQKNDIIGGVNETIRQQRLTKPDENHKVFFNVVTFNDNVEIPKDHTLGSVPMLTIRDYIPQGSTALFDAMGHTMTRYKNENNVIFIVATDGEENASSQYSYKQIIEMVKKLRTENNWNFIYLSEDIDTFKQGNNIGISSSNMNCNNLMSKKSALGQTLCESKCQSAISNMRTGQKNVKILQ